MTLNIIVSPADLISCDDCGRTWAETATADTVCACGSSNLTIIDEGDE